MQRDAGAVRFRAGVSRSGSEMTGLRAARQAARPTLRVGAVPAPVPTEVWKRDTRA